MKTKRKKILLIGPYPPPAGGVSIHIQRLLQKSIERPEFEMAVFDPGKRKFIDSGGITGSLFHALLFFLSSGIVHIHSSHPKKYLIGKIVKLTGKKLFFTLHNLRTNEDDSTKKLMNISDRVISVCSNISDHGSIVIPAYIPFAAKTGVDSEIMRLKTGEKIMVTIGTSPASRAEQPDTYGFDVMLKAIDKLIRGVKLTIIFIDVNGTYERRYSGQIGNLNANFRDSINIKYLTHTVDFAALMTIADVYVRATTSDGDSVAIREALAAGARVVASDAAARTEGCLVFAGNDENDLAEKINVALMQERKEVEQPDFSGKLFSLYADERN